MGMITECQYQFSEIAELTGIKDSNLIEDILTMVMGLKSNREILSCMIAKYGSEIVRPVYMRKITEVIQWFIIYNYYTEFCSFCKMNDVTLFDNDLNFSKKDSAAARLVFVTFLRENPDIRSYLKFTV